MDFMTTWQNVEALLEDYGPTAFIIIVLLFGLVLIYKAWPVISNFVEVVNALAKLPELVDTVGDIKKEVKPNGGSSLRDAVDGVRKDLTVHSGKLDELTTQFNKHVLQSETSEQLAEKDRQARRNT